MAFIKARSAHQQCRGGLTHPDGDSHVCSLDWKVASFQAAHKGHIAFRRDLCPQLWQNGTWPESHRCAARNLLQTPAIVCMPRHVPSMSVQISLLPQLVMDLLKPGLVSFEISRKNLVGEKINLFSSLYLLLKTRLSSCNATWSLLLWPVPLLQPLGFILWSLYPGVQQQQQNSCQHPGNICLGISTTVWSCCSPVWDLCLQRKSVQQQHRERKKRRKKGFI